MTLKATREQIRIHNRQLVLRSIYNRDATSRAALAEVTGLTKPAISSLVTELIDEGFLIEGGFGDSTESGGKRPRILQFLPGARQIIGIEIQEDRIRGVLTNLDSRIIARHDAEHHETDFEAILNLIYQVANGLIAQLSAELLCVGVGFPGLVDAQNGLIQYSARFNWQNIPLAQALEALLNVSVYIANSTQLASKAQFAFREIDREVSSLATIMVDGTVGIGFVTREVNMQYGGEIGYLRQINSPSLQERLAWSAVQQAARALARTHQTAPLAEGVRSYLYLKYHAHAGDPAALALLDQLSDSLAEIFAWVIALIHPDQISLSGKIAELGNPFLSQIIEKTGQLVLADLIEQSIFSIDARPGLVALGAATNAVQLELGLI